MSKRIIKSVLPAGLFAAVVLFSALPVSGEILCEGRYGGHLQGLAADGEGHIYWSFTVELVKTDMNGKLVKSVAVPSHHGDLTCHDGRVYVAVNLGKFNQEPGEADSWVYVYDAGDLSLLAKHEVPEVVHGAGGIAYHDGRFVVIGGLPKGYEENYAYEYDADFNFIGRHVIESGYTSLGIQTACYALGFWWFGCYGYPENSALLKVDGSFRLVDEYDTYSGVGFDGLSGNRFLQGFTGKDEETGKWWGKARIIEFKENLKGRFVRVK